MLWRVDFPDVVLNILLIVGTPNGGNVKLTRSADTDERERRLWSVIGTRLKIARKASLLSQKAMADKVGISRARWSMYELGKRPIRMIHLNDAIRITAVNWQFVMTGDEADVAKEVRSRMRAARQLEAAGDEDDDDGG
jgi:transcriptional regulator with XRE-family HTH domain